MSYVPIIRADEPMVGEIRMWPTGDPPPGWLICDGSTLAVADYPELHQTIFWIYGGYTGEEDQFNIPDLRGRVPVGLDTSKSQFDGYGETGGEISHTLTVNEMPSHTHTQNAHNHPPTGGSNFVVTGASSSYLSTSGSSTVRGEGSQNTTATNQYTGGGQPHNNLQPYITLNFIIYTGVGLPTPTPTATPTVTPTPIPGGQQTGPISGTITGSLILSQTLPANAFTTTLSTGNEFVFFRSASYGEIIAGAGGLMLVLGLVFYLVSKFAHRPGQND